MGGSAGRSHEEIRGDVCTFEAGEWRVLLSSFIRQSQTGQTETGAVVFIQVTCTHTIKVTRNNREHTFVCKAVPIPEISVVSVNPSEILQCSYP